MSLSKLTEGGWMWWVHHYKINNPDELYNYKDMMKLYMSGAKP